MASDMSWMSEVTYRDSPAACYCENGILVHSVCYVWFGAVTANVGDGNYVYLI